MKEVKRNLNWSRREGKIGDGWSQGVGDLQEVRGLGQRGHLSRGTRRTGGNDQRRDLTFETSEHV